MKKWIAEYKNDTKVCSKYSQTAHSEHKKHALWFEVYFVAIDVQWTCSIMRGWIRKNTI